MKAILFSLTLKMVLGDLYSSKYDSFDIQPLLENDRILLSYTKCFIDQGPCTPDAKDFKKVIPEALRTACGNCSPKQREMIRKVTKAVIDHHLDSWKQLLLMYDEDKQYEEAFNKFLAETD